MSLDAAGGPAPAPRILLLWDVDHTLIETRGVGFAVFRRAFQAATGRDLVQLAEPAGRTELDIMTETLRRNGVASDTEQVAAFRRCLVGEYETARDELANTGRALPGAHATLHALATDPALYQSILTGNLKDVARIKLEVFDLAEFLDLDSGAYGDDHPDRATLVAIAQAAARATTGAEFPNDRTVLLGDTPNDIRAATAAGVRSVGVATGKVTAAELSQAGADLVISDLHDPAGLRDAVADVCGP